ncbi:TetR/AcrR family transcriptional regulator [Streptomyces sp. NPDC051064]|uniref:TetR/AcrR family transcriptional regulator n=1 Tax=Streptomyces sp. NPDC051064 TaxID=3365641 RepID=UPI003789AC9A
MSFFPFGAGHRWNRNINRKPIGFHTEKQIGFHSASERVVSGLWAPRQRPTPASAACAVSTRDRLLDVAAQRFYEQGVHIGDDTFCGAAGVSKRSTYQLFGSKDQP